MSARCIYVFPDKKQCPNEAVTKGFCSIHQGDDGGDKGHDKPTKTPSGGGDGLALTVTQRAALYAVALKPIIDVCKEIYHIVGPHLPRIFGSAPEHSVDLKDLIERAETLRRFSVGFKSSLDDSASDSVVEDMLITKYDKVEADFVKAMKQLAAVASNANLPEAEIR